MTKYVRGYHFVAGTLRDGSPIPADGEWLEVAFPLEICKRGLHASLHVADALSYAPGNTLCLVELDGEHISQDDKVCYQRRRIVARFGATELLRAYARASALSVIHLWNAPSIVRQYLETGDKSIRDAAARAVAAAVRSDAAYAAYAAVRSAAAAAYAAYAAYAAHAHADAAAHAHADAAYAANVVIQRANRDRLQASVDAKFKELGV